MVSPLDSPPEGFRLPQWTPLSHDANVEDFIAAATTEPFSRASRLTSASEACLSTGISDTASPSSSRRLSKNAVVVAPQGPSSYLYRSFSRRCLSKFGSRRLFGWQKSEGNSHSASAGRQNRTLLFENGLDFQELGSRSEGGGKQPLTLSQLVASSTREVFRWSDVNSVSQLSWTLDEDGMNSCMPLHFERIRADFFQPDEENSSFESDDVVEKCGLCSRGLLQRSPWSSQGYAGNNDLPVVDVLACGHVFHADCLEKTVSEVFKANPSCPQCAQLEKVALKALVLRFDRVKYSLEPIKKRLGRLFKGKSQSLVLKANEDLTSLPRSLTVRRKGALLRSLSKLQAPLQVKAMKGSASHNWISS